MTKRVRRFVLIGAVLLLGACGAESDLFGPEANTPVQAPSYNKQNDHHEVPAPPPVAPPSELSRYAMAAS